MQMNPKKQNHGQGEKPKEKSKEKVEQNRKISEKLFSKVFKGLMKQPKEEAQQEPLIMLPQETQFSQQVEEKNSVSPSVADLVNFEYLYSSLKSISEDSVKKCIECIKIMMQEPIDQRKLSNMIYQGIDTEMKSLRPIAWRILIGYLPPSRKLWINILEKNAFNYEQIVDENIISKLRKLQSQKDSGQQSKLDHPLSRSKESQWNNYFEDQQLWLKIEQDTKRTRQREGFFSAQYSEPIFNKALEHNNIIPVLSKTRQGKNIQYRYDALTRILFLYAKLHGSLYVQGMNEIAALIYHCFANDDSILLRNQCEADTFYCFSILMTELKENFYNNKDEKDESSEFLKDRIRQFQDLLKKVDSKLFDHFQKIHLDLKFFCVKWFISSMAQEFKTDDALKLWDAIVCQKSKNDFVHFLALSLLLHMREDIIKGEFGEVMMIIQNLENQNIEISKVINNAYLLQKELRK